MSYRAFKRLLGETSLERKCHLLFGATSLLLITASFFWFAKQTEKLVYEQTKTTGRLGVMPALAWLHLKQYKFADTQDGDRDVPVSAGVPRNALTRPRWEALQDALLREFAGTLPEDDPPRYDYRIITGKNAREREHQPNDPYEFSLLERFRKGELPDDWQPLSASRVIDYYAPVRASAKCLTCHEHVLDDRGEKVHDEQGREQKRQAGDFMAMVRVRIPIEQIEKNVHWNRAVLIATALVTVLLIMGGSYLIVRYVIVKPVKHLKEVSDAISAGELNVRSEIQTGDEFEDLSHAFNRMLRNLVSMQDRLRKVNADLDHKVDELAQANLALFESNRLKGDFLATVSHELRTPLNSILGFSDVLLTGDPLSDKQQRWVGNIKTSGDRLLNLINDILDLAKIEAGKMEVRVAPVVVPDVCDSIVTMFRPQAEKKNIDLRSQVDPALPPLRQDVGKLQQILANLLSNAVKFTPEGGRVLLRAEAVGAKLVLTVSDTGVGIAPEDQELVFDKFRQAGNPLTREHAGTGLGLSIVRELAKLLGGAVTLQSELGRGSTFTVTLPLQLTPEPRLEVDLAGSAVDLSKAQRVSVRAYAGDGVSK